MSKIVLCETKPAKVPYKIAKIGRSFQSYEEFCWLLEHYLIFFLTEGFEYPLKNYLKEKNPKDKIFVVHRLDRDTSGVMIFAKSEKAQDILQTTWNDSVKERTYVALVEGNVKKDSDTIISYLAENKAMITYSTDNEEEGKKAVSHYKVLKRNKNYSLLEVNIETGRKNQIRVHMQDLGHSVVGDKKYGSTKNPIKRLGLHAHTIVFKHPITKEVLSFTSKIPEAFLSLFK